MKGSKVIILILVVLGILLLLFVALIMVAILVALLFWPRKITNNNTNQPTIVNTPVAVGEFKEFSYSPGYGDMNGKSIHETLRKDENGEWIIERRAREDFESPMIVTTYSVTDEDVKDFADFIIDNNVCGLENRPDSDLFITDYSAWDYGIEFDNSSIGGDKWVTYSIWEYKEYSDEDYALMEELDNKFEALHYNKISEIEETED